MKEQFKIDKTCVDEMTNEEYRERLQMILAEIDDNKFLRYIYILVSGLEKDIEQKSRN